MIAKLIRQGFYRTLFRRGRAGEGMKRGKRKTTTC